MKIGVAILAATGMVGQKMIRMLENHPLFYVAEVAASDKGVGEIYGNTVTWREETPIPTDVAKLRLKSVLEVSSPYVLSALPTDVSLEVEPKLAAKGLFVISNAAGWRMGPKVPLLVPEINAEHLTLISQQKTLGKIVTNPNCSTVFLVMAVAPLLSLGKLKHISATTLQALSGAGYPGVASFDLIGNTIPNIQNEEEKIREETKKILGQVNLGAITPYPVTVSVQVNRVPVVHGHSVSMHLEFDRAVSVEQIHQAYRNFEERFPGTFALYQEAFQPQPARVITAVDQRVHIGRIQLGERPGDVSLVSLGHNLVRGAAGAALLNLEFVHRYLTENNLTTTIEGERR